MATAAKKKNATSRRRAKAEEPLPQTLRLKRFLRRWALRLVVGAAGLAVALTLLFSVLNPPITPYMLAEWRRHGALQRDWVPMEEIAPVMARAAVAAEDANFCLHWGLDLTAIRAAVDHGKGGASTISQQTVKNVFLWHGRSWPRKALEALWTPMAEAFWSKRRMLEIYLNVAEFDTGVFGVEAAAQHYFGVSAAELTATQASRLAAILPAPKARNAANPSPFVRTRSAAIAEGAATIAADGRASCFEES